VDFAQFNNVVAVDTPEMSAKDMAAAAAAAAAGGNTNADNGISSKSASETETSSTLVTDEKSDKQ